MNKVKHPTEVLLEQGKRLQLSETEHAEMKAAVLSYARYHGVRESAMEVSAPGWWYWCQRGAAGFLSTVCLVVGVGYFSAGSIPGDWLYPIKIDVLEPMVALTQVTSERKLAYQHNRFEARFGELQQLQATDRLTPMALQALSTEFAELSVETSEIIASSPTTETAVTTVTMSDILSVMIATEYSVSEAAGTETAEWFEDTVTQVEMLYGHQLDALLTSATSTIELYIEEQLQIVSANLEEGTVASSTVIQIEQNVSDVQNSLQTDEYVDAVTAVSNSVILLKTEGYLMESVIAEAVEESGE
jgi:hypothetical protein